MSRSQEQVPALARPAPPRPRSLESVLVPGGALFAALCFFLPYVRVVQLFGITVTRTGVRLGGALWLVPLAALAILGAQLLLADPGRAVLRRRLSGAGAVLGTLILLAVVVKLDQKGHVLGMALSPSDLGVRPAVGWMGSLLGFGTVLVVALDRRARSPGAG